MSEKTFRLPTGEFRSLPIPGTDQTGKPPKLATCFVKVSDLPTEMLDWLDVNPRVPKKAGERAKVVGRVAKRMLDTLQDAPEIFAMKNQGIYLLVDHVEQTKEPGGATYVDIVMKDPEVHGVVNGGHTFSVIDYARTEGLIDDETEAYVRLHIMQGIDKDQIVELADGLNRSLQVNDASLENLQGTFQEIKEAMDGKTGEGQIAYHMGAEGSVDITDVLARLIALTPDCFPDDPAGEKQANAYFGQTKKVLGEFAPNGNGERAAKFDPIIPNTHEVLSLFDKVVAATATHSQQAPRLGGLGRKKGKDIMKKNPKPAPFADGVTIERRWFSGLVYPIFSAFRANVDMDAWENGEFAWLMDPDELLDQTIDKLCSIVRTAYDENKNDPAQVGKRQGAYFSCYMTVYVTAGMKQKTKGAAA